MFFNSHIACYPCEVLPVNAFNVVSQELTNRFSYDLPDLVFHLSVIKLCTIKALARPMEALAQGVGQWVCQCLLQ